MIDLPEYPSPNGAAPIYLDAGGILKGGLGAPDQRINRLGSRFGIAVTMPPLPTAKLGRIWVARLIRAQQEGGRIEWPLLDFEPGSPGNVLIAGAGQSGTTLNVDGATPNYVFREGQPFSIFTDDRHHMMMVATETIASGSGTAALPLASPIRVQHADNDPCHFGKPMIEGFVIGDQRQWQLALEHYVSLEYEIHERA